MLTESTMYWMTRLDEMKHLLSTLGLATAILFFACSAIAIIFIVGLKIDESEGRIKQDIDIKETFRVMKKVRLLSLFFLCLGILMLISNVFIPSTKEYAMIKVVPAIANDPKIREEASEIYDMAKQALKRTLELPEEKNKPAEKK